MKKILISIPVVFLIILTDVIFSKLLPFYLRPNLWLVYVIFIALFWSHTEAVYAGFLVGMIYDILHLSIFGFNTLLLTTTGYLIGWLNQHVDESLPKVQILILVLSCLLYLGLNYVLSIITKVVQVKLHNLLLVFSTSVVGYIELRLLLSYYSLYSKTS